MELLTGQGERINQVIFETMNESVSERQRSLLEMLAHLKKVQAKALSSKAAKRQKGKGPPWPKHLDLYISCAVLYYTVIASQYRVGAAVESN